MPIRTFGDAVKKFQKHYHYWVQHKEYWPEKVMGDDSPYFREGIKLATELIPCINKLLNDNSISDAIEACGDWDIRSCSRRQLPSIDASLQSKLENAISQLPHNLFFDNYRKVSHGTDNLYNRSRHLYVIEGKLPKEIAYIFTMHVTKYIRC